MWVKLGNISPKDGYRNYIDPEDYSVAELRVMCNKLLLPTDGDKKVMASLLSDVVRYRKIDLNTDGVVTKFVFPEPGTSDEEITKTVSNVYIGSHSFEPPTWVESDDEDVARLLAEEFNCQVGRPIGEEYLENNII